MDFANRFKQWMFSVPEGPRSTSEIIIWWELRRVPYNIIIGAVGICSLVLFFFFVSHTKALKPGEDPIEPFALLAAPFVVNALYTLGWIAEVFFISPAPSQ